MESNLTAEQCVLADYMSDLSEEAYCAGWLSGLEYTLWEAVLGHLDRFGGVRMQEAPANRLRELARSCGGWIVFDDTHGRTWLPFAAWEARFADWQGRAADRGSTATSTAPPDPWDSSLAERLPLRVEWLGFLNGELRLFLRPIRAPGPVHILHLEDVASFYDRLPRDAQVRISSSPETDSLGSKLPRGVGRHRVEVASVTPMPGCSFLALARRVVYRLAETDDGWPG